MVKNRTFKDEALIIRSIRHGESSRIITLFTKTMGKVAVIAKGARRSKSGQLGGVDITNLIEAIVYFKASRSVQTLGQISVLRTFSNIKQDLVTTGYAAAVLEMLNLSFLDLEPNPDALQAALITLDNFDNGNGNNRIIFWNYQLTILGAVGFAIDPYICPVCSRNGFETGSINLFQLATGSIICPDCKLSEGDCLPVSGETVNILRRLIDGKAQILSRLKPSRIARNEISILLENFLRFHISGIGKMPALKMLDSFEQLSNQMNSKLLATNTSEME